MIVLSDFSQIFAILKKKYCIVWPLWVLTENYYNLFPYLLSCKDVLLLCDLIEHFLDFGVFVWEKKEQFEEVTLRFMKLWMSIFDILLTETINWRIKITIGSLIGNRNKFVAALKRKLLFGQTLFLWFLNCETGWKADIASLSDKRRKYKNWWTRVSAPCIVLLPAIGLLEVWMLTVTFTFQLHTPRYYQFQASSATTKAIY